MYGYTWARESRAERGAANSTDGSYTHMFLQESADEENLQLITVAEPWSSCAANQTRWLDVISDEFNAIMGIVIVSNAILISFETNNGEHPMFGTLENMYTVIFTIEMVMRMYQLRGTWFKDPWNLFDCGLVCFSLVQLFVASCLGIAGHHGTSKAQLIRLCRLLRVLRILRIFRMFNDLLLILQAFEKGLKVVMWIGLLILLLNWMCAIALTQGIGHNAHLWAAVGKEDVVLKWFGDIRCSMQSLFIIMTLAEWDDMAYTLSEVLPSIPVFTGFMLYILTASYTMVSLITGIISESLVSAQQADLINKMKTIEAERQAFAHELCEILMSLDEDGNGFIKSEEVSNVVARYPQLLTRLAALEIDIDVSGIVSLVERLSTPGAGVEIRKLVEYMANLTGHAKASSIVDLKYDVRSTLENMHGDMTSTLAQLREDIIVTGSFLRDRGTKEDQVPLAGSCKECRRGLAGLGIIGTATKQQMDSITANARIEEASVKMTIDSLRAVARAEFDSNKAQLENQLSQQMAETKTMIANLSAVFSRTDQRVTNSMCQMEGHLKNVIQNEEALCAALQRLSYGHALDDQNIARVPQPSGTGSDSAQDMPQDIFHLPRDSAIIETHTENHLIEQMLESKAFAVKDQRLTNSLCQMESHLAEIPRSEVAFNSILKPLAQRNVPDRYKLTRTPTPQPSGTGSSSAEETPQDIAFSPQEPGVHTPTRAILRIEALAEMLHKGRHQHQDHLKL